MWCILYRKYIILNQKQNNLRCRTPYPGLLLPSGKAPGLPTHGTWGEQQNNPTTDIDKTSQNIYNHKALTQTALCKAASALLEAEHEAPGFVFSLLWSLTHYKSKGRPGCPSCTHTPPNPTPDSRKHCSQAHINSTQAFNPTWHICEQFKLTQQHLRHSKTLEIR